MAQRVQITIDLGANVPIEVIRQVIDDVDTVCQFGGELQYRVALVEAQRAVLSDPERWIPGLRPSSPWWSELKAGGGAHTETGPFLLPLPIGPTQLDALLPLSPEFAPAISRYMDDNNSAQEAITTVESVHYSNPIELVLGLGVLALLAIETARDWHARRRLNAAIATDFENQVLARKQLRDEYVRRIREGRIPLSATQIDELLTLDVTKAITALGNSRFDMRQLESAEDESEKQ